MHHCVTLKFGSAKKCSPTIFKTCFSFDKYILIAATDYYYYYYYYMYYYIIVLFPLTAVLQLIKFYSFVFLLY